MDNEYKSRDLYESSYLIAKGFPLLRIERALDSSRCYFIFDNFTRCKEIATEFWNKQGLINGKTYAEAINYLKDRIFSGV